MIGPSRLESVSVFSIAFTSVLFPAKVFPNTNIDRVGFRGLLRLAVRQASKRGVEQIKFALSILPVVSINSSVSVSAIESGVTPSSPIVSGLQLCMSTHQKLYNFQSLIEASHIKWSPFTFICSIQITSFLCCKILHNF